MATLFLTSRASADTQSLWRAAVGRGWDVVRIQGPRLPDHYGTPPYSVYTEEVFARSIAHQLQLTLIEPPIDWLVRLSGRYAQRHIRLGTVEQARSLTEPTFIKPPNDKSFPAKVYPTGPDLPSHLDDNDVVLMADPVEWEVEYRCFVIHRQILTLSPYLRNGILAEGDAFAADPDEVALMQEFARSVLEDRTVDFPDAVAFDVGRIKNRGWAVVELNAATSSGIYGCDPDAVLTVIAAASTPHGAV